MTRFSFLLALAACSSSAANPEVAPAPKPAPAKPAVEPARIPASIEPMYIENQIGFDDWIVAAIGEGWTVNVRAYGPGGRVVELDTEALGTIELWRDGATIRFLNTDQSKRVSTGTAYTGLEIGWDPAKHEPVVRQHWECDDTTSTPCRVPAWLAHSVIPASPALATVTARAWLEALQSKKPDHAGGWMGPRFALTTMVYGTPARRCKTRTGDTVATTPKQRTAAARCIADALLESAPLAGSLAVATSPRLEAGPGEVVLVARFEADSDHFEIEIRVSAGPVISAALVDVSVKDH
ncbi:MAG: hypothetical protein ABI867_02665 [Kofleriaceae bacterium]